MPLSVVLSAVMAFGVSMTNGAAVYLGRVEKVDWETAMKRCKVFDGAQEGKLATWRNNEDFAAIQKVGEEVGPFGNAWIGMHDDNGWKMVDGATDYCSDCSGIDKWNPGEPNNHGSEKCAEIYPNGNINNNVCSTQRNYICEWQPDLIRVYPHPDINRLYVAVREYVTWMTARNMCDNFGGHLATWSNSKDYWVIQQAQKLAASNVWVGLNDLNTQGRWDMVDGATDYCNGGNNNCEWYSGAPSNGGDYDCVEMLTEGKLNNIRCNDKKRYFICELSTGVTKWASSDVLPQTPWVPADPVDVPQHFVVGTYSAQDLMVVALAVFLVINAVTLAVFCLRAKGTATVRYAKVVAVDSDEDSRLNA